LNHIIKTETKEMISVNHPLEIQSVTRGAMADPVKKASIYIIFPVCYTTQNLGPDSVTAHACDER
jgi:hypothetical protein